MQIRVTGDVRQVAESAWISTLNEIKAKARSDDDARKVVEFLIDNHHTSPFESITITFEDRYKRAEKLLAPYIGDRFARFKSRSVGATKSAILTIDLLNFIKVTMNHNLFNKEAWRLFEEIRPELAKVCRRYNALGEKEITRKADDLLGPTHEMKVELVSFHDEGDAELSRATWRICCPLSIAVQILRHRSGSFNMTSGRYRTLRQDIIGPVKDCSDLFAKLGLDLNRYLGSVDGVILQYNKVMKIANEAKEKKLISNAEYKRIREFARFVLPEGRMTELYVTFYLNDFYNNYTVLRDSEDTQVEHIWVAQEMQKTLNSMVK